MQVCVISFFMVSIQNKFRITSAANACTFRHITLKGCTKSTTKSAPYSAQPNSKLIVGRSRFKNPVVLRLSGNCECGLLYARCSSFIELEYMFYCGIQMQQKYLHLSGINYSRVMLSKLHNLSNGKLTSCLLYPIQQNFQSLDYCDL